MGLGIMGAPMAANILKSGYPLTVYNRTPGKAGDLVQQGAAEALSPQTLAQAADIVIAMVTGPEALDELLFGPQGAAPAFNAQKVLINMSSVSPRYSRDLAARLAPTGAAVIDAPVSGTRKPALEGALVILAGGPEPAVAAVTPLLSTMGKKVIYCGPTGQGAMMKMAINLLLAAMMEGLAEMFNFGAKGGLTLEAMLETVNAGALASPLYQIKAPMFHADDYPVAFPLKHMTKDLKFIVDTAYESGAPAPAAHMLLHLYRQGVSQGLGDLDFAAIGRVLARMAPAA
jgi:3-hydroxyisobutyrate dehydrogenase-like beta-hydroxyacid dehydrogenase